MPMPAYKDTMQDEIKLMARAIVDQYETPAQKNCKFCHAKFDLAETKKIINIRLIIVTNVVAVFSKR